MKKMLTLLLTSVCLFAATEAAGSKRPATDETEANIVGHVLDVATRRHLPGAVVKLRGTSQVALTDASGHYFLKDVPVGRFVLEVQAAGYAVATREVVTEEHRTLVEDFEVSEGGTLLGDAVVSANRRLTRRRLAPSLVGVLDARLFEQTQSTDLSQSLKFQPGVRVETNCQNCGFSQVRINGLEGPYSQILIDSRPVFSALAGVYGLEQIPTNMIERVEVVRGGASALFGANAIAGVVNIITKEPDAPSATLSHDLRGVGGLHRFENTTGFNGTYVSDNARLGLSFFGQVRHRSGYDHDRDGYTELPLLDGRTLGARTFYKLSEQTKLTAEFHNTHEFRRGGDRLEDEPHNATVAEQLRHRNSTGSLSLTQLSRDGRHRLNAYASFAKVARESYYGGGTPVADIVAAAKTHGGTLTADETKELDRRMASYGRTDGLTLLAGAQYVCDFDRLLFLPASLTVGAEYLRDELKDRSGYRPSAIAQTVGTKSLFLQNEWRTERWSLLVGGRLDRHSLLRKCIVSPRANLRFTPVPDWVLRVGYSAGFRAPQIFDEDLHVDNAGGELILSENAPDLREERSHSISASADWFRRLGEWRLNLTTELFYTLLDHAFSFEQQTVQHNGVEYIRKLRTNSDGAKVAGVNFEGRLEWRETIRLQAGLTLQSSRWNKAKRWNDADTYATRRMYRTPNAYAYFVATAQLSQRLALTLSGNYTGEMLVGHEIPTEDDGSLTLFNGTPAATVATDRLLHGEGQTATTYGARTLRTPAFQEIGCKLTYTLPVGKYYSLHVSAGVQNLFNAFQKDFDRGPARDSAYIYGPGAPRCCFFGVRMNY